jgi:hypothetical protein
MKIPGLRERICYVNLAHLPLAIYKAVSRHPVTGLAKIVKRLGSKALRLGAYGDPAFLPVRPCKRLQRADVGQGTRTNGAR